MPEFARGLVRDFRVRWALEEVCQPYDTKLLSLSEIKQADHRAFQPFGQVPTLKHGEVELFESGAIALYIAQTWPGLLPSGRTGAAKATEWVLAALNSVEPYIFELQMCVLFERDEPWSAMRLPRVRENLLKRLKDLEAALGDRTWLDGETFTVGDLIMVAVLRQLKRSDLLAQAPRLDAYVDRGMARPPFKRAVQAQLTDFDADPPV